MGRTAALVICFFAYPLAALGLLVFSAPAPAQEQPAFSFPVDCRYGVDCFIQNYFDHDPGPGRVDYACGRLSYDGHDGTDIRLPTVADIVRDVPVLAAADGVVLRVRDGMADRSIEDQPPGAVAGREAGNGAVIDHGGGWETQYSHLRQGSLLVAPGETVQRGQPIGAIGLSGFTEFPHVEFAVRFRGDTIDPFVGPVDPGQKLACGGSFGSFGPVWLVSDIGGLEYMATAGLAAGFADRAAEGTVARAGGYARGTLSVNAPALVFWADVMGAMAGDEQRFLIIGPDGSVFHESLEVLESSNVSWFAFAGRRTPASGWPAGRYQGRYVLLRNGEIVAELTGEVDLQ